MTGSRSGGQEIPEFSVTEDSPRRLVLVTGMTRWVIAAILFAFGLLAAAGAWLGGGDALFLLIPAVLFMAGGAFFLLSRKRWTFDATRGTVAFDSLLWGAWEAKMGAVTGLEIASRSHGPAGEEIAVHALMMKVEGRSKAVRVNASIDPHIIREQKKRIEAMVEPWRGHGGSRKMLT